MPRFDTTTFHRSRDVSPRTAVRPRLVLLGCRFLFRGAAGVSRSPPLPSQVKHPPMHHCTVHRVSGFTATSTKHRIMTLTSMWSRRGIMPSTSVRCLCGWRVGVGRWAQTLARMTVSRVRTCQHRRTEPSSLRPPRWVGPVKPPALCSPPPVRLSHVNAYLACVSLEHTEECAGGWVEGGG